MIFEFVSQGKENKRIHTVLSELMTACGFLPPSPTKFNIEVMTELAPERELPRIQQIARNLQSKKVWSYAILRALISSTMLSIE
jgi:hypothetical protein